MTNNAQTADILNELIKTSEDGQKGFQEASRLVGQPDLKALFDSRAQTCAAAAGQLQNLVRSLGSRPRDSGSMIGTAHRGWLKIRSAVGNKTYAVLDEVERGEDSAKLHYAEVLQSDLPRDVRDVVEHQYRGVVENHDRIRALRKQYRINAGAGR